MIRAVIDIGSNSIKMRVARVVDGHVHVIRDETEVVRLSRNMSVTGNLADDRMSAACDAVTKMAAKAKSIGADIFIAGTMALRTALNSDIFLRMVKTATGIDVHVLSGLEEAKYSWLGASDGLNVSGQAVMFDSGGGSTEFVLADGKEVLRAVSVPVGAVNLTERFFGKNIGTIRGSVCNEAVSYVAEMIRRDWGDVKAESVIGVGGGVVAMAGVKNACENFVPSQLVGTVLTKRDIVRQIGLYSSLTVKERENIIGLPASRADVILGSACIVLAAFDVLGAEKCRVSINGLRHGLLLRF